MPVPPTSEIAATGAVASEAVSIGVRAASQKHPDIEIQPPFLYFHHPASWMVVGGDDGPELLPLLSQIAIEPGIGRTDKNGDPSLMIGKKQSKGWTMIPESAARATDTPDGQAGYIRRAQARRGYTHFPAWMSWRSVAGRASVVTNEPGYHAWLRSLLARGIIAPADPAVVERMLDQAKDRLSRAQGRDTKAGTMAARLAAQAAVVVERLSRVVGMDVDGEIASEPAYAEPPKPKRGRPTKADVEARALADAGTS